LNPAMAELLRKTIDDHSYYAIWKISETSDELRSAIRLSPSEESLYSSFVAESRKKQWLAYRLLLQTLLAPNDYTIEYDDAGKPSLAGSNLHISVTHTEDLAAVIISQNARVGIDLEKIKPRILKVRDKFLSTEENSIVRQETEAEQLTLAWCAKEALYKLFGLRTLDFRENIRVDIPSKTGIPFMAVILSGEKQNKYELRSEKIGDFILVYIVEQAING
jgi:phosphopantetheinyl transferase